MLIYVVLLSELKGKDLLSGAPVQFPNGGAGFCLGVPFGKTLQSLSLFTGETRDTHLEACYRYDMTENTVKMAYFIKSKTSDIKLSYLPKTGTVKGGRSVVLDYYSEKYEAEVHDILRYIVNEEGNSYPQDDMTSVEDFRKYYLSHDVFVCKDHKTDEILGAFYIKPNFPGRCSHICNAGFIVKKSERGQGLGKFMAENYLYMARDLGYKASFFNLVFVSNEASIYLWRKLGFKEIGKVPNAGNLKDIGYTDALQFYYDLTTLGDNK